MSSRTDHPMDSHTDLEERLAAALAARADLVAPGDLRDLTLPATVVPLHRRPALYVVLAAAACLALVATFGVLQREPDRVEPAPEPDPDRPSVVVPSDVGADWSRAEATPPARLDLDGDGTEEVVRFLAEPDEDYQGRVRLQTRLSTTGDRVFGLLEPSSTLSFGVLPDAVDLDGDGDGELVLYDEDGRTGFSMRPIVFDLRDGALVEAPPLDPDLLRRGEHVAATAEDGSYQTVRMSDYWIEDGRLFSVRSVEAYPTLAMSTARPPRYVNDAWEWRLADDGVLEPVERPRVCVELASDVREPCAEGERDALPTVVPVARQSLGPGESFSSPDGFAYTVRVEAGADGTTAVRTTGDDGRTIVQPLDLGPDVRVLERQPVGVFYDGVSLVAIADDGGGAQSMQVLVQREDRLVRLDPDGSVPLGTGTTGDGRPFRTWLTEEDGTLFTAVADTVDEQGAWSLSSWAMTEDDRMTALPRATDVCFDDPADPATMRRC